VNSWLCFKRFVQALPDQTGGAAVTTTVDHTLCAGRNRMNLSGSGQRSPKVTRRYADLSAKDRGQMALVGEADFLGDHS
jgi:hypothetical protein